MPADIAVPDRAFTLVDGGERPNTRPQVTTVGIALPTEVSCTCCEDQVRPYVVTSNDLRLHRSQMRIRKLEGQGDS